MANWAAAFRFAIALHYISVGKPWVHGLQSSWGYRAFNVKCDPGIRLTTGHTLVMFPKTRSKAQCLQRCFARPECQSISYLAGLGECYLSSSTKEASGATGDGDYVYCGPETAEVWERDAITVELPTTTTPKATTPAASIRLVDGPSPNEGRVEIYYNGGWGTVCDDGWDINDGHVACRELGYQNAAQVWCCAYHGQGSGAIVLDDVACSGSEASLAACSHREWGLHNCVHSEDSSVKCV